VVCEGSNVEALAMRPVRQRFVSALREAGMPPIPAAFSVSAVRQEIPRAALQAIDGFVRLFDRITNRDSWQERGTATAPAIARDRRREVCFFSAWDFHLPPGCPEDWQLIEFNDNGSGFLFAAAINRLFYETGEGAWRRNVEVPCSLSAFHERLIGLVEREAVAFFGKVPDGSFLVLDDAESLERGRFRDELLLLRDLFRRRGWQADVASPAELRWDGSRLRLGARVVTFVVNRSTDFFWEADVFPALRAAYGAGRVYVAPNPFTYATRSDKRLLEFLSHAQYDQELGIRPEERALLSAHVPPTSVLRAGNLEELAGRKDELVFKPTHGFAGRGLLPSSGVGRSRLRRLLRKGAGYVAQQRAPRSELRADGGKLWTDLRVWAYRGERLLLSGRGSRHPDGLDLRPPGGWLPTYERVQEPIVPSAGYGSSSS
jgi:hypothetical protein